MPQSIAGRTILIVEDQADVQAIGRAILTRLGCRVDAVASALEAIAHIEEAEAPVDVVFSDIHLAGGMTGLDLAVLLRQRWPGIKTILTSGYPGPGDVRHRARDGGFPVLAKPYRTPQLAEAIRSLLEGEPA